MFFRVCPLHNLEVYRQPRPNDPDPDSLKGAEIICCPTNPPHLVSFWLVKSEDGVTGGLSGQLCGGYTAFEDEEWADIPAKIEEEIEDSGEELINMSIDTEATEAEIAQLVEAKKRLAALQELLVLANSLEEVTCQEQG